MGTKMQSQNLEFQLRASTNKVRLASIGLIEAAERVYARNPDGTFKETGAGDKATRKQKEAEIDQGAKEAKAKAILATRMAANAARKLTKAAAVLPAMIRLSQIEEMSEQEMHDEVGKVLTAPVRAIYDRIRKSGQNLVDTAQSILEEAAEQPEDNAIALMATAAAGTAALAPLAAIGAITGQSDPETDKAFLQYSALLKPLANNLKLSIETRKQSHRLERAINKGIDRVKERAKAELKQKTAEK